MLKPIKTKVLIKPDGKKTVTASGIFTGAYSLEKGLRRGTVVAIGDKVRDIKEGDRVCWSVESGNLVEIDGTEHALMHETEVIGHLIEE